MHFSFALQESAGGGVLLHLEGKRVGTRICRLSRRGGQAEHDLMLNRIDDVDGGDYYYYGIGFFGSLCSGDSIQPMRFQTTINNGKATNQHGTSQ